jgi:protein-tyrosine-phosphatase
MTKNKPVTPERAIQILAKHNIKVTREQAEQILEFMSKLAQIAIDVYVNDSVEHYRE